MSDQSTSTETSPAVLDLANFDLEAEADRGAEMELYAPRPDKATGKGLGDPLGIKMMVLGDESPQYRANLRALIDEVQMNLQNEPTGQDAINKITNARTAACAVVSWEPFMYQGQMLEFSRDNAIKLFYERPWICRQVENFRSRAGNFGPR